MSICNEDETYKELCIWRLVFVQYVPVGLFCCARFELLIVMINPFVLPPAWQYGPK